MNPAIRGGVILFICLLAVFPCGAALTVMVTLAGELMKSPAGEGAVSRHSALLSVSVLWASAGVLGFLFLINGIDKMLAAQRRLPWYALLAICLEIGAAGFFSATYPLRGSSALIFRLISVAPVAIGLGLLVRHLWRFIIAVPRPDQPLQVPPSVLPDPGTQQRPQV